MIDNLQYTLMKYLMDGSEKRGGFLNYFDIGYLSGGTWESVLISPLPIKAKRFVNSDDGSKIEFEGNIPPSALLISEYPGESFFIRVLDGANDTEPIAEVEMNSRVEEYFQSHLSATTEIMIMWQLSLSSNVER